MHQRSADGPGSAIATRSRLGPRVPWMIWSALPARVEHGADVVVPTRVVTAAFRLVRAQVRWCFMAAYTGVNLPYCALATRRSPKHQGCAPANGARIHRLGFLSKPGWALLPWRPAGWATAPRGYLGDGPAAGAVAGGGTLLSAWAWPPRPVCRRPSGRPEPINSPVGAHPRNGRYPARGGVVSALLWGALAIGCSRCPLLYLSEVMHPAHLGAHLGC